MYETDCMSAVAAADTGIKRDIDFLVCPGRIPRVVLIVIYIVWIAGRFRIAQSLVCPFTKSMIRVSVPVLISGFHHNGIRIALLQKKRKDVSIDIEFLVVKAAF